MTHRVWEGTEETKSNAPLTHPDSARRLVRVCAIGCPRCLPWTLSSSISPSAWQPIEHRSAPPLTLTSHALIPPLFLFLFSNLIAQPPTSQVDRHREHLFYYMLFLRITPFLPNWFINITAPVLDIPLGTFFWGTFFGE